MYILEYGVEATITFSLVDFGATDFESTPVTFAAGDVQISKDGAAFANVTNSVSHVGNGVYKLTITATEMQAKNISITLIDQTATKEWEDQFIPIITVNNGSAQLPNVWADVKEWDSSGVGSAPNTTTPPTAAAIADQVWDELVADHQTNSTFGKAFADATTPELAAVASGARNNIADSLLSRDLDNVEATAPVHSLLSAALKLVSRFVASTGVTYRTDGTTTHMTQTPTTDASADPVTELGVGS